MSHSAADRSAWLKRVLGIDLAAATESRKQPAAAAPGDHPDDETKRGFFTKMKQKLEVVGGSRAPAPADADLGKALDDLDDTIDEVKDLGLEVAQLEIDRNDCAKAATKAEKLAAGSDRDKAVAAAKKRMADLQAHAESLKKAFASVMGKSKGPPSATQKSALYKKALEDHYGITVENPSNMANTHLDRVFDMMGTVPVGDAKQDKMKHLKYFPGADWKGSGAYNKTELTVKMGDFGDATGMENYEIDGEVLPANSFDVTTLHEIGHSVDHLHSIMSSHGGKGGCGGWQTESIDSIATIYLGDLKSSAGLSDKAKDPDVKAAITTALKDGTTAKPDEIEQPDWEKVVDFLSKKCLPIRSANSPWFKTNQVVVGGRVYQQAYSSQWVSYDHGSRASTRVNNYQWRAPGEWFAEVYAISWLKKKKPPSGVDSAVLPYMWNG